MARSVQSSSDDKGFGGNPDGEAQVSLDRSLRLSASPLEQRRINGVIPVLSERSTL